MAGGADCHSSRMAYVHCHQDTYQVVGTRACETTGADRANIKAYMLYTGSDVTDDA